MVVGLMAGVLSASAAHAQDAPKNPYIFAGDGAVMLNFIKADKVADYEMLVSRVKDALQKSDKPERKQQAEHWAFYKAAEPGPNGAVVYVSMVFPAVKGADYGLTTILNEAFPEEGRDLYQKYVDALAGGNILNLTLLNDLSK
jgi:hypothetical protein